MGEKVTMLKLEVDLNCSKCYKKVKKVLRKFPQIQDQLYNENSNTIIVKVICYSPENLMNKLCYKGDGSIKSIVILEPPKPTQAQGQPSHKPKETEKASSQALVPAQTVAPTPQLIPMNQATQAYHCGPYYEDQQYECYRRPIYDSWGGGTQPQCSHDVTNQQSCSII